MVLNIMGVFTAVLDRESMEILVYEPRNTGEEERGSRTGWTWDGEFITSITADAVVRHGDNPWNMTTWVDGWRMSAEQFGLMRTWIQGVLREGEFRIDGDSLHVPSLAAYRVRRRDDSMYRVMSCTSLGECVVGPFAVSLTRDDAYALAALLSHGR
jgi:hypothetical protein